MISSLVVKHFCDQIRRTTFDPVLSQVNSIVTSHTSDFSLTNPSLGRGNERFTHCDDPFNTSRHDVQGEFILLQSLPSCNIQIPLLVYLNMFVPLISSRTVSYSQSTIDNTNVNSNSSINCRRISFISFVRSLRVRGKYDFSVPSKKESVQVP